MSVVYVIFDIDPVSGTAKEWQSRKDIRTGDIRISDEFQKLAHRKIWFARLTRTGIDLISELGIEISNVLENYLYGDFLIPAFGIAALDIKINIKILS